MPELPDVEVFRRYFDAVGLNRRISRAEVLRPSILEGIPPEAIERRLQKRIFISSRRHGKNLFVETDAGFWLVMHFGMSGFLYAFNNIEDDSPYDRFRLSFEDGGFLSYDNRRMIGRIAITETPGGYISSKRLGPDAFTVDFQSFRQRVSQTPTVIKQALMDQERVAGIGNIYADEILFQSRISPEDKTTELTQKAWHDLYQASRQVLKTAVDSDADPSKMPRTFLLPARNKRGKCPRCGMALTQSKMGGRTTFSCSNCQRRVVSKGAPVSVSLRQ